MFVFHLDPHKKKFFFLNEKDTYDNLGWLTILSLGCMEMVGDLENEFFFSFERHMIDTYHAVSVA